MPKKVHLTWRSHEHKNLCIYNPKEHQIAKFRGHHHLRSIRAPNVSASVHKKLSAASRLRIRIPSIFPLVPYKLRICAGRRNFRGWSRLSIIYTSGSRARVRLSFTFTRIRAFCRRSWWWHIARSHRDTYIPRHRRLKGAAPSIRAHTDIHTPDFSGLFMPRGISNCARPLSKCRVLENRILCVCVCLLSFFFTALLFALLQPREIFASFFVYEVPVASDLKRVRIQRWLYYFRITLCVHWESFAVKITLNAW